MTPIQACTSCGIFRGSAFTLSQATFIVLTVTLFANSVDSEEDDAFLAVCKKAASVGIAHLIDLCGEPDSC